MLLAGVIFVATRIYLVGDAGSGLHLPYFLAILTAALTRDLKATVAAAVMVSALYLWVSFSSMGASYVLSSHFLLRIPLFFVTSFFAGYLATQGPVERKRAATGK